MMGFTSDHFQQRTPSARDTEIWGLLALGDQGVYVTRIRDAVENHITSDQIETPTCIVGNDAPAVAPMIDHVALWAGLLHAVGGQDLAAMDAIRLQEDHATRFTGRWGTEHDHGPKAK